MELSESPAAPANDTSTGFGEPSLAFDSSPVAFMIPWNTTTGELAANGIVNAEPIPNALAVGLGENFLYSAGQESGNMATFGIDAGSGQITRVATIPLGNPPAWISIVQLP